MTVEVAAIGQRKPSPYADSTPEERLAAAVRLIEHHQALRGGYSTLPPFDDALQGSKTFDLDGYQIPYIGKAALIANKKSAGRHKDLADVEELERLEEG